MTACGVRQERQAVQQSGVPQHDCVPEGFCSLEKDVPEALSHGIDAAVLSHLDPEEFPEINAFLGDTTEV